jgi:hypothetical protein
VPVRLQATLKDTACNVCLVLSFSNSGNSQLGAELVIAPEKEAGEGDIVFLHAETVFLHCFLRFAHMTGCRSLVFTVILLMLLLPFALLQLVKAMAQISRRLEDSPSNKILMMVAA